MRGRAGVCEWKRDATQMQQARAGSQALRAFVWVQDPYEGMFYFFLRFFFSGLEKMKILAEKGVGVPGCAPPGGALRGAYIPPQPPTQTHPGRKMKN